jgi:hypothetical protein
LVQDLEFGTVVKREGGLRFVERGLPDDCFLAYDDRPLRQAIEIECGREKSTQKKRQDPTPESVRPKCRPKNGAKLKHAQEKQPKPNSACGKPGPLV